MNTDTTGCRFGNSIPNLLFKPGLGRSLTSGHSWCCREVGNQRRYVLQR